MKPRALLGGLAAVVGIWTVEGTARRLGRAANLIPEAPWEQASPADAMSVVMLGGMRGPYVGYLWYKSSLLFSQDRENLRKLPLYYGPMGTLQPRFVEMWTATGQNLAFDAAAKFRDTPELSWSWIRSGIERMRDGIRRNPSDPRLYKLHFSLGWAYLKKCTPETEASRGRVWRELAQAAWGEDPFELAIRHFREAVRSPDCPQGYRYQVPHTFEAWARVEEDPLRERERLLSGLRAWDELALPGEPEASMPDHRGRLSAHAAAAVGAAEMHAAFLARDAGRAHRAWWEALAAYERAYFEFKQFFLARGGGFTKPPHCADWPYAPMRMALLAAPRAMWEAMAGQVARAYAGMPEESALERRYLSGCADLVEAYRATLDRGASPWAAFADMDGAELLSRAKEEAARGRAPEAAAYLARILRFEKDASLLKEAETLIETLR